MKPTCPTCYHSQHVQSARSIWEGGTYEMDSQGFAYGAAFGDGVTPAVGRSSSTGRAQSILAQRFDRPEVEFPAFSIFFIIVGGIFLYLTLTGPPSPSDSTFVQVSLGAIAIGVIPLLMYAYEQTTVLPRKLDVWRRTYYCHYCERSFIVPGGVPRTP